MLNISYIHKMKRYLWTIFIVILIIVSFNFSYYKHPDQNLDLVNIPPIIKIIQVNSDYGIYIHKDLYPVLFTSSGKAKGLLRKIEEDDVKSIYLFNNKKLILNYRNITDFKSINYEKIKLIYDNKVLNQSNKKILWNQSNILGTDQLGRDIFQRVCQGVMISLIIGLAAAIFNLVIGVLYGCVAGYIGGMTDIVMLNILNIINSIPPILIVILLSLFVGEGISSVVITIGLVYWVGMARQVRAQVMTIKQRDFILAAIVMGIPRYKIIFKHIIPNIKETIFAILIVNIQNAIFTESFLSFLGIGLPAHIASLGTLVNESIGNFKSSPYQLIIPSLAILFILICFERTLNFK